MDLPKSTIKYTCGPGSGNYFRSRTRFVHSAFALNIPDTGWSITNTDGVRLSLSLPLSTLDELRDLFGYLHDTFGLSSNGAFTIHQSQACWHGSGVRSFIAAVEELPQRYADANLDQVHHSEDLIYFDEMRNGWISVYGRGSGSDI